ncbi:MAG: DUF1343 domain-containing protein [Chlamydiia bacterium]|nr:DUF1343 domain-containing protein [Chlamydiia bacterium]
MRKLVFIPNTTNHFLFATFGIIFFFYISLSAQPIKPGVEQLFDQPYLELLAEKRVGLVTNQTGVDSHSNSTITLLQQQAKSGHYTVTALFGPEHGLFGIAYAEEFVKDEEHSSQVPIYSLYNKNHRPTKEMLEKVDVLIFDIQDIGCRSYTYTTTLFYVMEEAQKAGKTVIVLDRPNPINGIVVDGPMFDESKRSMVGHINIPYCHGMTLGELAVFFNEEYQLDCTLHVVPMKGWKRSMSFGDTGLPWIPTSPQIPFFNTPLYSPITGILGELHCVNIGIGYTLPFQVVGASWIDPDLLAKKLNEQDLPGVLFSPIQYRPFFGSCANTVCKGVLIHVIDPLLYQPVTAGYVIMGILKSLYPAEFARGLEKSLKKREMFGKVNGTDEIFNLLKEEKYVAWKLRGFHQEERKAFMKKRAKYLNPLYSD